VLHKSTPEFGVPTLRLLTTDRRFEVVGVVTRPDKPDGRNLKVTQPPIKVAAEELGIQVLQPQDLRTPEAQAAVHALEPDLGAVAAYGQWIPSDVFDFPPMRTLNLHPSLLPRHRGVEAIAAWVAGEITPRPQDYSQATWVDRLEKKAGLID
jgi:methionyl-tRNA formyltransferase